MCTKKHAKAHFPIVLLIDLSHYFRLSMFKKLILATLFTVCIAGAGFAQKTAIYTDPVSFYNRGLELYDKEKYGSAIDEFEEFISRSNNLELQTNAQFYIAVSSLQLEHQGAEERIKTFIKNNPGHIKTNLAHFHLGRYYYNQGKFTRVPKQLLKTNDEALTIDESLEYHFMLGYSYFKRAKWQDAEVQFNITANDKTKYYYPSHYYLGYGALKQAQYQKALSHFERLKKSKVYKAELPVFFAQVYFGQKKYKEVLAVTDTLKSDKSQREINWLRGQSFYYLEEYEKALPLLDKNRPPYRKMNSTDKYVLGYTFYANGMYEKAFNEFTFINNTRDTVTQYAYYNAAECFLRLNRKNNARDAFLQASLLSFNAKLKERSTFNYAKLSYDLGFNTEALRTLRKFIKQFPKSSLATEAKTLQGELLLASKNYKEAIEVLESIGNMNNQTQKVYQQITYYRAIQLLEEGWTNMDVANGYLLKSKKYPWDKKLDILADFWRGEIAFHKGKYWDCIKHTRTFLNNSKAKNTDTYPVAYYNIGYSYLKIANTDKNYKDVILHYEKAADNFRSYTKNVKYLNQNKSRFIDGMTRLADCYFVLKRYDPAIEAYNYIITKRAANADYGYYQKGIIFGLQGKDELKISTLKKVAANYPRSQYVDDALFEIADVHQKLNNLSEALKGFGYLLGESPNGIYAPKCHLRIGTIHYQQNNNQKAIISFKKVIEQFGAYPESNEAAKALEEIYSAEGRLDEFFAYMKNKGRNYKNSYRDSASYDAALRFYQDENCNRATGEFARYLKSFPEGLFAVEANFYKANCEYQAKNFDAALEGYLVAINSRRPEFIEPSTRAAATIYYLKKDYNQALPLYEKLEGIAQNHDNKLVSLLGQMRCSYYINDEDKSIANSKKLLAYDKVTREGIIEANIYLARINIKRENWAEAKTACEGVLKYTKNQYGAEAKYYIAYIQYKKNQTDGAEKTILEVVKKFSSYDYWKAKALLLQSDILVTKKDLFQARAILKSIINAYENKEDGIITDAKAKLATIGEEDETEE